MAHVTTQSHSGAGCRRGSTCDRRWPDKGFCGRDRGGTAAGFRPAEFARTRAQDRQRRAPRRRRPQDSLAGTHGDHGPVRRRLDLPREPPRLQRFSDHAAPSAERRRQGHRPAHDAARPHAADPGVYLPDRRAGQFPRQGGIAERRRHRHGGLIVCCLRRIEPADGRDRAGDHRPEVVPDLHEPRHGAEPLAGAARQGSGLFRHRAHRRRARSRPER